MSNYSTPHHYLHLPFSTHIWSNFNFSTISGPTSPIHSQVTIPNSSILSRSSLQTSSLLKISGHQVTFLALNSWSTAQTQHAWCKTSFHTLLLWAWVSPNCWVPSISSSNSAWCCLLCFQVISIYAPTIVHMQAAKRLLRHSTYLHLRPFCDSD